METGRNNSVTHYRGPSDQFILKRSPNTDVGKTRFDREFWFLRLCNSVGITGVPQIRDNCAQHLVLELSFESGTALDTVNISYARQMLDFLRQINLMSGEVAGLPFDAIESVATTRDFTLTIDSRLKRLEGMKAAGAGQLEPIENVLGAVVSYLRSALYQKDLETLEGLIERTRRSVFGKQFLSPSDFGSHNILVNTGRLKFIDFEYAGFDSGLNLLGDTITQPDTVWGEQARDFFAFSLLEELFNLDQFDLTVVSRPYSARWLLVMLLRANALSAAPSVGVSINKIQRYFQGSSLFEWKGVRN
jgi:hypothetical protein